MTALKITAALFGWLALAAVLAPVVGRRLRGRDDLMALVDATAEPDAWDTCLAWIDPPSAEKVEAAAAVRAVTYGAEDFDEWSREFHPSLRDFDPRRQA